MAADAAQQRITTALRCASDTRVLRLGQGTLEETGAVFAACFGQRPAMVVADTNTFEAAGRRVHDVLVRAGVKVAEPFVYDDPDLHAYYRHVIALRDHLAPTPAVPVAVGSGTINDLVKLAAHESQRSYMSVATAASMDGYTAYGASVTHEGSKQTFFCPAPFAVIADLDVIGHAPGPLNAAGYADLAAKVTAGADWIVADVLGREPIDARAFSMVQAPLRGWLDAAPAVRRGDRDAIAGLIEGLLMTGFAMQWSRSSRPASGAEHQFSHLWDMQHHRHAGHIPYHGYKVAIGTLASTLLYERLFETPLEAIDVAAACAAWPELEALEREVLASHDLPDLQAVALQEIRAKYVARDELERRLCTLVVSWPGLRERLRTQLVPADELRQRLQEVGSPSRPAEIGISSERLRVSYRQAWHIRRRFTVLDLAAQAGVLSKCVDQLFAPGGAWGRIIAQ